MPELAGLIDRSRSRLLVVDLQQKLLPAVRDAETLVRNAGILIDAARGLDVPVLASEQYPTGLGPTVPEVAQRLRPGETLAKLTFSCMREPALAERLSDRGRPQVVVCGAEGHVCVLQTALDLRAGGADVFVVTDAVSTRREHSMAVATRRMEAAGIHLVTTEMVVFEWLRTAADPAFRTLSRLIR